MKLRTSNEQAGLLLIECMVYIGVFLLLATVALAGFYVAWDHHRDLARNARLILNATDVGERWRAEVRQAEAPIEVDQEGGRMTLPGGKGPVVYRIEADRLLRANGTNVAMVLLEGVKASRMLRVEGELAQAWRWELELAHAQKAAQVAPLFVFTAVPRAP